MRKLFSILSALAVFTASTQALAGGTVPQGFGMYNDGRTVNTVPASSNVIRWRSYGSALTPLDRDTIQYAIALTDYETQQFSFFWTGTDEGDVVAFFSGKSNPVSPECLDGVPGGCVYAETNCLAKIKIGSFDFCSQYRTSLYMANIAFGANVRGISRSQFLRAIVRHETGHVLGLSHFDPGPMTSNNDGEPFSDCQHAMWEVFNIDPAVTTWTYPTKASVCQ
jgi:hypothetical protein